MKKLTDENLAGCNADTEMHNDIVCRCSVKSSCSKEYIFHEEGTALAVLHCHRVRIAKCVNCYCARMRCSKHIPEGAVSGVCTSYLSLGVIGRHPANMTKPLEVSLSELFLHWEHPCSL